MSDSQEAFFSKPEPQCTCEKPQRMAIGRCFNCYLPLDRPTEPPASEPPSDRGFGLLITPCERKMVECPDCHGLFAHGQAASSHTELRAGLERLVAHWRATPTPHGSFEYTAFHLCANQLEGTLAAALEAALSGAGLSNK